MYIIRYALEVCWVGDGTGPLSVPSAQKLRGGTLDMAGLTLAAVPAGQPTGTQPVPGGDSPSQSNFNTAISAMATDLENNFIAPNLTRIQAFSTGGG